MNDTQLQGMAARFAEEDAIPRISSVRREALMAALQTAGPGALPETVLHAAELFEAYLTCRDAQVGLR